MGSSKRKAKGSHAGIVARRDIGRIVGRAKVTQPPEKAPRGALSGLVVSILNSRNMDAFLKNFNLFQVRSGVFKFIFLCPSRAVRCRTGSGCPRRRLSLPVWKVFTKRFVRVTRTNLRQQLRRCQRMRNLQCVIRAHLQKLPREGSEAADRPVQPEHAPTPGLRAGEAGPRRDSRVARGGQREREGRRQRHASARLLQAI